MYIKTSGIQSLVKYWRARESQPTLKIDMPLLYKRTGLSLATCHEKYREYARCSCEERMLLMKTYALYFPRFFPTLAASSLIALSTSLLERAIA